MKFVLATQNPHKRDELSEILSGLGIEVVTEEEIGLHVKVEETGASFAENAALKAKAVMEASGMCAIGDDSGLCVNALKGAPGIHSARYGGEGLSDSARCSLLLEALRGQTDRRAYFETVLVCAFPNGEWIAARGQCHGTIAFVPMGSGGFGYDPIFFYTEMKKTFAQMTAEEKASVSHRGNALREFREKLANYLEEHHGVVE